MIALVRRALVVLALAWLPGLAGCEEDKNKLFGSVSEVYPLAFDAVAVSIQGSFLVIEYTKGAGKVVKLSVSNENLNVQPGQAIDLLMPVTSGKRGTLQRIVETTVDLPMETGTLTLDGVPKPGAELTGHFRTLLTAPSGRTLNGDFSATVR